MPRKSIYDIIAQIRITPDKALQRILLRLRQVYDTGAFGYITPLEAIDRCLFKVIPVEVRRTCFDFSDLLRDLNIDIDGYQNPSFGTVFNLVELLFCIVINTPDSLRNALSTHDGGLIFNDAIECANQILVETGHEVIDSKDGPIVVTVDTTRDLACEISDEDTGINLLEYTHYSNKGNLKAKCSILQSLYKQNEPTIKLLRRSSDPLIDDLNFIANNINIRHNNEKDAQMISFAENEIEDWYDLAYRFIIYAIIKHDLQSRHKDVKQLKISKQAH